LICQNANFTEADKNGNPSYEDGYGEVTQMEKKKMEKKKKK